MKYNESYNVSVFILLHVCSPIICVYAVPSSSSIVSNVALYKDELKSRVNLLVEVLPLTHNKS
jgi:hypothetical protein